MELENVENSERYIRKDVQGGYIYNKSEISYYRQSQKIDVINNLMLGDYNQKGAYVLNEDLIEQLVKLTKVYQYSFGSTMFCESLSEVEEFGKIDFAIKIKTDSPSKGKATAILEILESIDKANGYYTNTNIAQISTFTALDSPSFVVDALKHFNVISKKESGLINKEHKEENVDLIVSRKRYEDLRKNLLSAKIEDVYKTMFNKKMKLLQKSAVGKKVLDKFAKDSYDLNGWFVKEGMNGYYKAMDELLQSCIEHFKEEIIQDVKTNASLNKLESECAKMISNTMMLGENTMLNSQTLNANTELATMAKAEHAKQKLNESATMAEKTAKPAEKTVEKPVEKAAAPTEKKEEVKVEPSTKKSSHTAKVKETPSVEAESDAELFVKIGKKEVEAEKMEEGLI